MKPHTIEFRSTSDNTWVMRITADRKIEVNEDVDVTFAAKKVLDAMQGLLTPQRKPLTSQERDAKRWRFLMENSYDSESVTQFHVWEHSWEPHSQTGEPTEWKQRVRGIALIDFIDRAIEAAHGIKENT